MQLSTKSQRHTGTSRIGRKHINTIKFHSRIRRTVFGFSICSRNIFIDIECTIITRFQIGKCKLGTILLMPTTEIYFSIIRNRTGIAHPTTLRTVILILPRPGIINKISSLFRTVTGKRFTAVFVRPSLKKKLFIVEVNHIIYGCTHSSACNFRIRLYIHIFH